MENKSSDKSKQYNVGVGSITIFNFTKHPVLFSVMVFLAVIVVVAAIVFLISGRSSFEPSAAVISPGPIPPPGDSPSISVDLPTDSPSASPAPLYGRALKFKVQSIGTPEGGPVDVVFPESAQNQIERFNAHLDSSDTWPLSMNGLDFGGYSLGGVEIALHIENNSGRKLSISAIRVEKLREQPIATGAIFYMPSGSGDAIEAFMVLDYPDPVLRRTTPDTRLDRDLPHEEKPFFSTKGLPIDSQGTSEYLALTFIAHKASYDFAIYFDYSFQGDDQVYTQVLQNGPQPWRVSARACHGTSDGGGLKPGLKYNFIRNAAFRGGEYTTLVGDQAHSCTRWADQ